MSMMSLASWELIFNFKRDYIMTKLEEMMEAHEDAIKMSKEWNCSYDEAFRKVWDCVWYDDEGEVRDRPSERKTATLLTPGA